MTRRLDDDDESVVYLLAGLHKTGAERHYGKMKVC